jgi:hypothetical protein
MDECDSATAAASVYDLGKLGCVLCFQHLLVPCDAKYIVTAIGIMMQICLMDSSLSAVIVSRYIPGRLERLRKDVAMAEEGKQVSGEISVTCVALHSHRLSCTRGLDY